tara:strand:+ start:72 stop:833 length:762 start_codon:yes stop_codon:yes gene_type:complete
MKNFFTTDLFYKCFLILIILLLANGFNCKYASFHHLDITTCEKVIKNFWNENGLIENLQVIFVLISILFLIRFKLRNNTNNFINFFVIVKIVLLIYYLGEEISWGQHYLEWKSPEIFIELNNQSETNLHNISNVFDQLPRALVYFWCTFSALLVNQKMIKTKISKNSFFLISPNSKIIYISYLLMIVSFPDAIIDNLNLHPGHVDEFGEKILSSLFYDFITFNYIRLSELHELIFSFYFLNYSIFINKVKFEV